MRKANTREQPGKKGGCPLANRRTRFNVRESTAIDPDWEIEKAIDLWERMLASRLRILARTLAQKMREGASE